MTAATADPAALKASAVQRVIARRRKPVFRTFPGPVGDMRVEVNGGDPETAAPVDLAQWIDDRQCRCSVGTPICDTLITIFEALRDGEAGVADAVRIAARLDPVGQHAVWVILRDADPGPSDVEALRLALSRQWNAKGLRTTPVPVTRWAPERPDLNKTRADPIPFTPAGPAWLR